MQYVNLQNIRQVTTDGTANRSYKIQPAVTKTIQIYNELHYPVGIASRDGLKYDLPANANLSNNVILVQVHYVVTKQCKDSIAKLLCTCSVDNSKELQLIKQQLVDTTYNFANRESRFSIEYVVTEQELKDHGGIVYIRDLDMVFSTKSCEKIKYHPYSREADLYAFGEESFKDENIIGNNFIYSLKIIDNFDTIGKRWLRIGNDVIMITPTVDVTKSDGIYIGTKNPSVNSVGSDSNHVERYDVEDTPPYFKLYKHFHEARHTQEDEAAIKLSEHRTKQIRAESELSVAQLNLEKITQENKNLREANEIVREKNANEMRTLQRQMELEVQERLTLQRKDKYEALSVERKNTAELVKVVPTIILAIIGVVATAQKVLK